MNTNSHCHVGNTAKQCRPGLFQDSDSARDVEGSNLHLVVTLCIFGCHTFAPTSWMCKEQTSVSHSSTESEIMSLAAGLRLDGILALDLWDLIVSVLGNISRVSINLERQFYLDCSSDTLLHAGRIWKGDVLIADLEELETMDASEIYSKRLNAKEVIFPKEGEFIFPVADGRIKTLSSWRRSRTENIHLDTAPTNSRRGSR